MPEIALCELRRIPRAEPGEISKKEPCKWESKYMSRSLLEANIYTTMTKHTVAPVDLQCIQSAGSSVGRVLASCA